MSNETDLDWLARNVNVWREGKCEVLVRRPRNVDTLIWSSVLSDTGWITKEQWLARRAELQNKPSWDDAPEWATNLVQIGSGAWVWCDNDRLEMKFGGGDRFEHSGNYGAILGNWRDTLEKRPEEFKPFISIEDNQDQVLTQQQDNGWFERGELPPVGVECEAKKYGKEEWYKVVICGAGKHLGLAVAFYEKQKGSGAFTCSSAEYFRPIRTEREVAIEEMQSDIAERWANCEELAKHLVDKGWVKGGK